MAKRRPNTALYVGIAIALLVLVALAFYSNSRQDQLTAWATIKSTELHSFMGSCRDQGGTIDVRPNEAPMIVFVCTYADRMVEYTLAPR